MKSRNKQRFLNLSNASINGYIYHGGRDYTAYTKPRKKTPNELSVFLKTSFIFVKMHVQIAVLKHYMESVHVRYNSDFLLSQRSEP